MARLFFLRQHKWTGRLGGALCASFFIAQSILAETGDEQVAFSRSVDQLIEQAIEFDANRQAAQIKADADESIRETAEAGLLPRLDLSASYTRLSEVDLPPFDFGTGVVMDNPFPQVLDNYSLKASLAIPLMGYLKNIIPRMKQTEHQAELSKASLEQHEERVAFMTRQLLLAAMMQHAQISILKTAEKRLDVSKNRLQQLFDAGQIKSIELEGVKTQAFDVKYQIGVAKRGYQNAITQLETFTGAEKELIDNAVVSLVTHQQSERLSEEMNTGTDRLLELANQNRPELSVVKASVDMLSRERDIAKRGALPDLNLVGQYEYSNPNQRIFPLTPDFNGTWAITAQASWSPNDLIGANTLKKRANAQLEEAKANLTALKRQIKKEVEEAYNGYVNAQEAIVVKKRNVTYTNARYAQTEIEVENGVASSFDVLDREQETLAAGEEFQLARMQYALAEATLLRALGITFENELHQGTGENND